MLINRFDQYLEVLSVVSAYSPQAISCCHCHYHESLVPTMMGSGQLHEF